jgi:hypothetical protein
VPSLVKIGPEVVEKLSKMKKLGNGHTNDGELAIRKAHLS